MKRMRKIDPKTVILAGVLTAVICLFFISYVPTWSFLDNIMTQNVSIEDLRFPYRYVLVVASLLIAYGIYKLKIDP